MTDTNTAEFWATRGRSIQDITVKEIEDDGTNITFTTTDHSGFIRKKAELGRDIAVGEQFRLETVNGSMITGLQETTSGRWLFRKTNEDLAREATERSELYRRNRVAQLERNKERFAAKEAALPEWLHARIQRFRDASGEQFLLDGWGYELAICALAEAYESGDQEAVDRVDTEQGCSGNQHGVAKLLVELHAAGRDYDLAHAVPAGLSPITGSADYS